MEQDTGKLDRIEKFLREQMPTKTEIQEMRSELADKKDINKILTSVDGLTKQTKDYNEEVKILGARVETMSEWIKQAAQKLGIEYKL